MFLLLFLIAAVFVGWLYATSGIVVGLFATLILLFVLYIKKFTSLCMLMGYRKYATEEIETSFKWFEKGYKHGMDVKQKVTYSYYLLREGEVDRCEAVLSSILGFKGAKPEERYLAKSHHALLLMKTGRQDEALEELLEIFPVYKNSIMYGSIGYLYILMGDMKKAEEFNLEAVEYNSEDKVILDNMVQVYNILGEKEKAFSYAEKLMEKNPTFIEGYYNAALAAKNVGKTELAVSYLEKTEDIKTTFLSNVSHEQVSKLLEELKDTQTEGVSSLPDVQK